MNELLQEGLLWVAMIFPAAGGVLAAVVVVIQAVKKLAEAVQTFTASQEVKALTQRIEGLMEDNQAAKTENAQLHAEIRLLVDQIRRISGYADIKLGGEDRDSKV